MAYAMAAAETTGSDDHPAASVGIGANTLIFSFVNVTLLKPIAVRHPENLWLLEKTRFKQVGAR